MKKLFTLTIILICLFKLGWSQNLKYINSEKFDFKSASYEKNTGYDNPVIFCNHKTDLSYFDIDFDPNGILSSSIFEIEDNEILYSGSFYGDSEVLLEDVNLNKNTNHKTLLLQLNGPCKFTSLGNEEIYFQFPQNDKMTGIVNYYDEIGIDSFWLTHFIWDDFRYQKLWSAGDLTLISGAILDSLVYTNPDNSQTTIKGTSAYNACIFAIDKNGFFKWSYVTEGGQYTNVVEQNEEIIISHDRLLKSRLINLDIDGNELKITPELQGLLILKVDFDAENNMFICGMYSQNSSDTNIDLNGGEYYLESESQNSIDAFLIKYDSMGNLDWAQTINGSDYDSALDFVIAEEYIYLTGGIIEDAVFDNLGENKIEFQVGEYDNAYISKYLLDGTLVWVELFENEDVCIGQDINLDENGLSIFGSFRGEFDANPNPDDSEILLMENPGNSRSNFHVQLTEKTSSRLSYNEHPILLMPNPVSSYLKTQNPEDNIICVKDMIGITIKNCYSNNIDLSALPNGIYIVTVESGGVFRSEMISVVH